MGCISSPHFGIKKNKELSDKELKLHGSNEQHNISVNYNSDN
jgi:hypothetical protein